MAPVLARTPRGVDPSTVWVVVPAYGLVSMTQSVVRTLLDQGVGVVLVVDNGGDYVTVGAERVLSPSGNLGWLRGTNAGTQLAFDGGASAVLWLNNDTAVSPDFVKNLAAAAAGTGTVGAVVPTYDQHVPVQRRGYDGPAAEYVARPVEHQVSCADGTAVLVTADVVAEIGLLDEAFALHGWGAIEDYALRLTRAGFTFVVTERAYVNHQNRVTAKLVNGDYENAARAEMWLGLRKKYGKDWKQLFPDMGFVPDESLQYLRHQKRLRAFLRSQKARA